jgi:hypothetical protein
VPFVSKAQRAYLFKNKPEMAKEWEAATPKGAKLPEHVKATAAAPAAKPSRFTPNRRFSK